MTPEQQQIRDITVNILAGLSIDERRAAWDWIDALYVASVRKGWPDLSDEEVEKNRTNFTIAVGSRLMQIEASSGQQVGHA